ncbi:uncharacterized protein LY79DRAFT_285613 [Colletotrichum navitas]|uniref:Uncharacterized protein n=1 Tax=Colletotrichum navitas TaxID=681940 RepID=A0AAD8V9S6_9PEZI|nr:uncharacterized protein LY79DRAFT_285613 [Colletotrichum navitas]KAK1598309.1 hypothetical protein LY79DRAFT_285613 [Colletotrichum navitas]
MEGSFKKKANNKGVWISDQLCTERDGVEKQNREARYRGPEMDLYQPTNRSRPRPFMTQAGRSFPSAPLSVALGPLRGSVILLEGKIRLAGVCAANSGTLTPNSLCAKGTTARPPPSLLTLDWMYPYSSAPAGQPLSISSLAPLVPCSCPGPHPTLSPSPPLFSSPPDGALGFRTGSRLAGGCYMERR